MKKSDIGIFGNACITEEPISNDSILQVLKDDDGDVRTEIVAEYTSNGTMIIRGVHQWSKEIDG